MKKVIFSVIFALLFSMGSSSSVFASPSSDVIFEQGMNQTDAHKDKDKDKKKKCCKKKDKACCKGDKAKACDGKDKKDCAKKADAKE